jgi:hypothetical protein
MQEQMTIAAHWLDEVASGPRDVEDAAEGCFYLGSADAGGFAFEECCLPLLVFLRAYFVAFRRKANVCGNRRKRHENRG